MPYQISNFAKRPAWQAGCRHRPSHLQPLPAHFCPQLPRSKPDGLEQEFCRACSTEEYLGPELLKQMPGWNPLASGCEGAELHCPRSQWPHPGSTLAEDLGPEVSAHHQSCSTARTASTSDCCKQLAANNTSNAHLLRGRGKGHRSFNCSKQKLTK